MENKPNENKIEVQTYEQPAESQQFVEPEWMKILKKLMGKQQSVLSEQYPIKTKTL
jgi:hypothetical protein